MPFHDVAFLAIASAAIAAPLAIAIFLAVDGVQKRRYHRDLESRLRSEEWERKVQEWRRLRESWERLEASRRRLRELNRELERRNAARRLAQMR